MKNVSAVVLMSLVVVSCSSAQINQTLDSIKATTNGEPTNEEVGSGLQEALIVGISLGAKLASREDGYFKNQKIKIHFPPEIKYVEDKMRKIGLGSEVDKMVLSLNRGAEDAAKSAKPIFVAAIKGMTIKDVWAILKGKENAATNYLKEKTSDQLIAKFSPIMKHSLDKAHATKYYGNVINTYNKIPFVEDVNPDLNQYATQKAVDGLFIMIAEQEKLIRFDPLARTTDLLKKVFGWKGG